MKRILFCQHGSVDGPGLVREEVLAAGGSLDVWNAWSGENPPDVLAYEALVLGGGGQSAWDDAAHPHLAVEVGMIRSMLRNDKPVLGLCLGAQLLARALGARLWRAAQREIGFFPVTLCGDGIADECAAAFPPVFQAAHWHSDHFDLPMGAVSLASSVLTPTQIFRAGRGVYGCQFHPEMTPGLFQVLAEDGREDLAGEDIEMLLRESQEVLPVLEPAAREFFRRWLSTMDGGSLPSAAPPRHSCSIHCAQDSSKTLGTPSFEQTRIV